MKIKVAIAGTVGKSVQFDPEAGARAEAAVAALQAQISAGLGASLRHSSLAGLQIGDDHPQYTGNQFPETITGQWNFQTIPFIQGDTLAEYIEDVVGSSLFDFIQDTTSITWQYADTAGNIEANVVPEFVQDTVGAMLVDTATVDFAYDDALGQISATVPGAALTRTDDTNVTLTLGGSAATALARAASLTLGWTGQLSVPRGGSGAATLTGYLKGNGASAFTAVSSIPYSDISGTPSIPTGANPSASVGLAAVNGSASTFMRSDGAPALDQGIAPLWTADHTWANAKFLQWKDGSGTTRTVFGMSVIAGEDRTLFNANGTASYMQFQVAGAQVLRLTTAGNAWMQQDNAEIQLGAGNDLRLYHDGTNSIIRTDTGGLRLQFSTNNRFEVNTTGVGFNGATPIARPDYTVTNPTTNRSVDVTAITHAQLAQVVGTMIQDLINYGLYQ